MPYLVVYSARDANVTFGKAGTLDRALTFHLLIIKRNLALMWLIPTPCEYGHYGTLVKKHALNILIQSKRKGFRAATS